MCFPHESREGRGSEQLVIVIVFVFVSQALRRVVTAIQRNDSPSRGSRPRLSNPGGPTFAPPPLPNSTRLLQFGEDMSVSPPAAVGTAPSALSALPHEPPAFSTPSGHSKALKRPRIGAGLINDPNVTLRASPLGTSATGWATVYDVISCAALPVSPVRPQGMLASPPKPSCPNSARGGKLTGGSGGKAPLVGRRIIPVPVPAAPRAACNVCCHTLTQRLGRQAPASPAPREAAVCPMHGLLSLRLDACDQETGLWRDTLCPAPVTFTLLSRLWELLEGDAAVSPSLAFARGVVMDVLGTARVQELLLRSLPSSVDASEGQSTLGIRCARLAEVFATSGSGCTPGCAHRGDVTIPFSLRCLLLSLVHAWLLPDDSGEKNVQPAMAAAAKQLQCCACDCQKPQPHRLPFTPSEWCRLTQALGVLLHECPYRLVTLPSTAGREDDAMIRPGAPWRAVSVSP